MFGEGERGSWDGWARRCEKAGPIGPAGAGLGASAGGEPVDEGYDVVAAGAEGQRGLARLAREAVGGD